MDLQGARQQRRLEMYRARIDERLRANRAALTALYEEGRLFERPGSRQGRMLLRARERWQRAHWLLAQLSGEGTVPAPRLEPTREALYREVEALLAHGDAFTGPPGGDVSRFPGR